MKNLVEFYGCDRDEDRGRDVDACKEIVRYGNRVPDARAAGENQDASTAKGNTI